MRTWGDEPRDWDWPAQRGNPYLLVMLVVVTALLALFAIGYLVAVL
jgi:hypothetical protein